MYTTDCCTPVTLNCSDKNKYLYKINLSNIKDL